MKYSTYLFDFDGTLVDSMPAFVSVMLSILDDSDIKYANDILKIITPLGYKGAAEYFKKLGVDLPTEEITALMKERAYEKYAYSIPAKTNVISVLRELKGAGANLNVLTASPHSMLDPCLKRLGIYDVFTNVWSCDDFKITKSDPQIYTAAAEKIGEPTHEILFLDDNYNADKTAKTAGMKVCGVFDATSEEYAEEIKAVCDHYIYDFSELITLE